MTPQDEISKLAREYAEETVKAATDLSNCLRNEAINVLTADMEEKLSWLLRTHCIVSKEKVNEEYQKALNQIAGGRGYDMPRIESYGMGKQRVLESLFDAETFKNSEA